MRDITPGEELLVWYGNSYERYMDLPICFKAVNRKLSSVSEEPDCKCVFFNLHFKAISRTVTTNNVFALSFVWLSGYV